MLLFPLDTDPSTQNSWNLCSTEPGRKTPQSASEFTSGRHGFVCSLRGSAIREQRQDICVLPFRNLNSQICRSCTRICKQLQQRCGHIGFFFCFFISRGCFHSVIDSSGLKRMSFIRFYLQRRSIKTGLESSCLSQTFEWKKGSSGLMRKVEQFSWKTQTLY